MVLISIVSEPRMFFITLYMQNEQMSNLMWSENFMKMVKDGTRWHTKFIHTTVEQILSLVEKKRDNCIRFIIETNYNGTKSFNYSQAGRHLRLH